MDGRRKLSDEDIDTVRLMLKQGLTLDHIARKFGISTTHVSKIKHNQIRTPNVNKSVVKALEWLLAGKVVKRKCWQPNEYLRYSRPLMRYELWLDGECDFLDTFDISGYDITVNDWILGTQNKKDGTVTWPKGYEEVE